MRAASTWASFLRGVSTIIQISKRVYPVLSSNNIWKVHFITPRNTKCIRLFPPFHYSKKLKFRSVYFHRRPDRMVVCTTPSLFHVWCQWNYHQYSCSMFGFLQYVYIYLGEENIGEGELELRNSFEYSCITGSFSGGCKIPEKVLKISWTYFVLVCKIQQPQTPNHWRLCLIKIVVWWLQRSNNRKKVRIISWENTSITRENYMTLLNPIPHKKESHGSIFDAF